MAGLVDLNGILVSICLADAILSSNPRPIEDANAIWETKNSTLTSKPSTLAEYKRPDSASIVPAAPFIKLHNRRGLTSSRNGALRHV